MESSATLFQEIFSRPTGIKQVDKLAASLAKSFKPTVASSLEKANELAFWLFIYGKNELSLRVCQVLGSIPFNNNYNLWTWIETALALAAKLLTLAGEFDQAHRSVAAIKEPFEIEDQMHRTIKSKALSRRLNGDLLQTNTIAEAVADQDKKSEMSYRFAHLKELVYIEALGGSEAQPSADLEHAIRSTVSTLTQG